jgi:DNA polymerase
MRVFLITHTHSQQMQHERIGMQHDAQRAFKEAVLAELYKSYHAALENIAKEFGCKSIVFSEGSPTAKIMVIGEAPGADEDEQGRPFVGRSGKLLERGFSRYGVPRSELFISNIVRCRPPNNRTPLPHEIAALRPLLLHEIKIVQPKVIVTLGASALRGVLDADVTMSQARGRPQPFAGTTLLPTYHPAYILRSPGAAPDFLKDIEAALTIAGVPLPTKND